MTNFKSALNVYLFKKYMFVSEADGCRKTFTNAQERTTITVEKKTRAKTLAIAETNNSILNICVQFYCQIKKMEY